MDVDQELLELERRLDILKGRGEVDEDVEEEICSMIDKLEELLG